MSSRAPKIIFFPSVSFPFRYFNIEFDTSYELKVIYSYTCVPYSLTDKLYILMT